LKRTIPAATAKPTQCKRGCHFANLYTGVNSSRLTFQKRYDDICTEWLGGLAHCSHKSVIERDQLGPHLRQLVADQLRTLLRELRQRQLR
jgi:hypothetical protein